MRSPEQRYPRLTRRFTRQNFEPDLFVSDDTPMHPPSKPITPKEIREADRLVFGTDFGNRPDLSDRSKRKISDFHSRARMVPLEVLNASDADKAEKAFLLGQNNNDPQPLRSITYFDLIEGEEMEIDILDIQQPIIPGFRSYMPSGLHGLRRVKFEFTRPSYAEQQTGTMDRQYEFAARVGIARRLAMVASDADPSEIGFIVGVKTRSKYWVRDPHPDHTIRYRSLIPAPVPQETPIFVPTS